MTALSVLLLLLSAPAAAQCPSHPCSEPFHPKPSINDALAELKKTAASYNDESSLRQAFAARLRPGNGALAGAGFYPDTHCVFTWLAACFPNRSKLTGRALWEWGYLDADQTAEAEKYVAGEERWEKLPLQSRAAALEDYLFGEARLLLTDPYSSSAGEINRARRRFMPIRKDIPDYLAEKIQRRLLLAEAVAAVKTGLGDLWREPEGFDGLPLEERAEQARQAIYSNNAAALFPAGSRIKRLLESGERAPSLNANTLDALARRMISLAWLTSAGKRVLSECEKTGCRITITAGALPGPYGRYTHREGRIVFNEKLIWEWASFAGADISSGTISGPALDALAMYLSPIFVHELTHLAQDNGENAASISIKGVQEDEYEAAAHEAAYFMEMSAAMPAFREQFARAAKTLPYAQAQKQRTTDFATDPVKARRKVMIRYAYRPSTEAMRAQIEDLITRKEAEKDKVNAAGREKAENYILKLRKALELLNRRAVSLNNWADETLPRLGAEYRAEESKMK